jgi:MYXO-CTERM domain-containing protein
VRTPAMRSSFPRLALAPLALALAGACLPASDASACAILPVDAGRAPHLSVERVAILYDEVRRIEHFVREVRFDGASSAFAFVVPTPGLPEVSKVASPPFDDLTREFPLDPPPQAPGFLSGFASASKAAAPEGVALLSTQQVGKFTAFVLAATDPVGLGQWLTDNRIALPSGGKEWLDHYVRLNFYFTAFRYESPGASGSPEDASSRFATPPGASRPGEAPAGSSLTSETVRLSFPTAVPFFPYLEPARADKTDDRPHSMEVWLVSRHAREPRLRRMAQSHAPRWGWAWEPRLAYEPEAGYVAHTLGELGPLLPRDGRYHVQTFRDERTNRDGWGDVLFPIAKAPLDAPSWRATATSLLGDLDRSLHVGELEPGEIDRETSLKVPLSARGCACAVGEGSDGRAFWLALTGLALLAARLRQRSLRGVAR